MSSTVQTQTFDIDQINANLLGRDAKSIVKWAADAFGEGLAMTSSFGAQSAVMLHLVTQVTPKIPIVFIDTGFMFPETYRFADELTKRLNLNLKVYQAEMSPARMVALKGKLWEKGREGLDEYDRIRKVDPLSRALDELGVKAWLAGLRKSQTDFRRQLPIFGVQNDVYKILPILDWSTKDVHEYLKKYNLPYHPLHEKGYVSIGDWHSTLPITAEGQNERDGRFKGLKQECGIHIPQSEEENLSRDSSGL